MLTSHLQTDLVNSVFLFASQCLRLHAFFIVGGPRWEPEPSVIQNLLYLPSFSSVLIPDKELNLSPRCQYNVLTPSEEYVTPKTRQKPENNGDLSHTHTQDIR